MKLHGCNSVAWIYGQLGVGSVYHDDLGMCAFYCICNCFGVVVLHTSIVNWRRGMGSVCTGICTFFYMWNFCSVVVIHRSMVTWEEGDGVCLHWYLCILLYVKLSWCSGLPKIYDQLEEGRVGSVCTGICAYCYMCKCSGLPEIYGQFAGGSLCPRYLCIMLYVKLIQCSGLPYIYG